MKEPRWMRMDDACKHYNISRSTLDRNIRKGLYKKYKLGGMLFVDANEIDLVIKRSKAS